jgi:MYXO-CTERM domain-containing protein/uncharacterized repeat protein (TIGR01451 family)
MHRIASRTFLLAVGWLMAGLSACDRPASQPMAAEGVRLEPLVVTNPSFEADAVDTAPPSGWAVNAYLNHRVVLQDPETREGLALDASAGLLGTRAVGGATEMQHDPDINAVVYPRFGMRAAVINFAPNANPAVDGNHQNVNGLKQQLTIEQSDVDPDDSQIHIRFVLVPVLENPAHDVNEQPYYFIRLRNLTRGTVLYDEFEVSNQPGVPWQSAGGGTLLYTAWQLVDVAPGAAALAVGDVVEAEVIAAGCSRGQHFGRVYVDAYGSTLPGLFTAATAPRTAAADTDLAYSLHYKNGGSSTANNAQLQFTVPAQTTYVSSSLGACALAANVVTCPLGDVAAGVYGDLTITVHVAPNATGKIVQGNYLIRASNVNPLLGSHTITTIPGVRLLVNVSSGATRVTWNQALMYTITVANVGTDDASNVAVTSSPTRVLDGAWTCSGSGGGTCGASGTGNLNDAVNLPAGASVTYQLAATVAGPSGNTNVAQSVTATLGTITDTATETLSVSNNIYQVTASKTGTVGAGSIVSFTTSFPFSCGTGCTMSTGPVAAGTTLQLYAAAPNGGTFDGWTGCSSTTGAGNTVCVLNAVNSAKNVSAAFRAPTIERVSGSPQSTLVGTPFNGKLDVLVKDPNNNPLPNTLVTFDVIANGSSGAAAIAPYTLLTGADGHALLDAVANSSPGNYQIKASLAGSSQSVTFDLTNLKPAALTVVSGDNSTLTVDMAANAPVVLKVTDAMGAALAGVPVTFSVPGSGASATTSPANPVLTDANGQVSITPSANTRSGAYTITSAVSGGLSATIHLTNAAGAPSSIEAASSSTPQSATVATAFGEPLRVRVLDTYGNPVQGASVSFTAPSDELTAVLSSSSATTDADGYAGVTARASSKTGSYDVVAQAGSVATTFALTNTQGDMLEVAITGGSGQSTVATQGFDDPIVLHVADTSGNPVPNRKVHVDVSGDTNSVPAVDDLTTDDNGDVSLRLTATATPGTFTLTFSVDGSDALTSTEFTVDPIPTQTSVAYSGHYTLHATVKSGHGTPTGRVRFMIDDTAIGEADLDGSGMATLEYGGDSGLEGIFAEYDAQGSFEHSRSTPISLEEPPGTGGGPETDAGAVLENDAGVAANGGKGADTRGWKLAGGSGHCTVTVVGSASSAQGAWLALGVALFFLRRRRASTLLRE